MTTNLFQRLREMLPLPPVLVGTVLAHHADDTSTVEIPGSLPVTGYAGNVATGSLIRPRGTHVPVGKKAFVRAGVIETQAPDGDVVVLPVGRVIRELVTRATSRALHPPGVRRRGGCAAVRA